MSRNVKGYVRKGILTFQGDPADTQFQRGYLNALLDTWDYATDSSHDDKEVEAMRSQLSPRSSDKLPDVNLH